MPAAVPADPLGVEDISILIVEHEAAPKDNSACFEILDHLGAGEAVDNLHHLMLAAGRAQIVFGKSHMSTLHHGDEKVIGDFAIAVCTFSSPPGIMNPW
jgi:hypothetical protein